MTLQLDRVPEIDYEAHPSFAGLRTASEDINAKAETLIAEIDAAYDAAQAAHNPQNAFEECVLPLIAALESLAKAQPVPALFTPFLMQAFEIARSALRQAMTARGNTISNSAVEVLPEELRNGLAALRRDGFYETGMPGLAVQAWRGSWVERMILRARAARNPQRHASIPLHYASPASRAIRREVHDSGLTFLIAAYLGKPVSFCYAALDYAHPGQHWFKGCYASDGMSDSKTVYMHFDADSNIIKALFYIKDVTERDGPFCFVRGSHNWHRSPFRLAVHKGFDEASASVFPLTEERLDYLDGYYRPRFQVSDYKAGMLALPRALRGSTHFGDDIMDGSPLSEALLLGEHAFVAPAGTMVIFDGSRGIHRGSLTEAGGERWAVQLAFRVGNENDPLRRSAKARVKARLSYFKYATVTLLRLAAGRV
jgi:hypothetical protein